MPRKTKETNNLTPKETKSKTKKNTNTKAKKVINTSNKKESKKTTKKSTQKIVKKSKLISSYISSKNKTKFTKKFIIKKFKTLKKQKFIFKISKNYFNNKSATKKVSTKKQIKPKTIEQIEYYDLPYRYNQTVIKLLYQTPKTLFIYWDISDKDKENFKKNYGENFFEITKPVLIVHNITLNYSFEVEINDFANSWYLHVNDSKCEYKIELVRRPIEFNQILNNQFIPIISSNKIESPNDKVLFNNDQNIHFKNVKTNVYTTKKLSFITHMGKTHNIYDLYQNLYQNEDLKNVTNTTSSKFK